MKALIFLLICKFIVIDSTLIHNKIHHSLNQQQHNIQQHKITHSRSINAIKQHHNLKSRTHKNNYQNPQIHLQTQHRSVTQLFPSLINLFEWGYDKVDKSQQKKEQKQNNNNNKNNQNTKSQQQQQSTSEEQVTSNSNNLNYSVNYLKSRPAAGIQLTQEHNCAKGQAWYAKGNRCIACTVPGTVAIQVSATGLATCYYVSPNVPVMASVGPDTGQCKYPKKYIEQQQTCYSCPPNFIVDLDLGANNMLCWCDQPNIFIQETKKCETTINSKENTPNNSISQTKKGTANISNATLTNSSNKNVLITKCPDNYISKVDNVTKKTQCQCLSPFIQQSDKVGKKTCLKHTCPKDALYDIKDKQCKNCPQANFVLKINNDTKRYQCICELPFKVKIVGGVQKCVQK